MNELINKLTEAKNSNKTKIEQLAEDIQETKMELRKAEIRHKNAVLEDDDELGDLYFSQVQELKRGLERKQAKFNIISKPGQVTADVKEAAETVLNKTDEEMKRLLQEEKQLEEEIEAFRETYFQKIEKLGKVLREKDEVKSHRDAAHSAIDPSYEPTYSFAAREMKPHHYKIDHAPLIDQALRGTRNAGVTR